MAGTSRRQLSWRARQGSMKLKEGSKKAAVSCWGDFINPRLIPLKVAFFLIMGATQCVGPYLTLLLKAVGLTKMETAIVYTIGPIIPILSPFIAGCVADRMGNFRILLVITIFLSGLSSLTFIFIPPARTTPDYSSHVDFDLTCGDNNFMLRPNLEKNDCDFVDEPIKISIEANDCGYICPDPVISYPSKLKKKLKNVSIRVDQDAHLYHVCEFQSKSIDGLQKCYRFNANESYNPENMPNSFSLHDAQLDIFLFKENNTEIEVLSPKMINPETKAHCPNGSVPRSISVPTLTLSEDAATVNDFSIPHKEIECFYHCHVTVAHNITCKDQPNTIEHNVMLTLGLYVGSQLLLKFMIGFSYTLFEIAVLAILKEYNQDYGMQRVYGSIGGMVFAPLTGFLIDLIGYDHYTDYIIAFVLYCGIKILSGFLLTKIDLKFRRRSEGVHRNICSLFLNLESNLLIFIMLIAGICYGFIENFLSWHLHDLGATDFFIGLMTTVASAAALPFLVLSGPINKTFGHVQSMVFGLICYGIRCIGYSMIKDPWWAIPFEILEGVTTGLLVASAIIYGTKIANKYNLATLQGILATCHYGFGRSCGSFAGGYLMTLLGTEKTFLIFSGLAFTTGFFYYVILKIVLQPRQEKVDTLKRQVSNMPIKIVPKNPIGTLPIYEITCSLESLNKHNKSKYTSTPIKQRENVIPQKTKTKMDHQNKTEHTFLDYEDPKHVTLTPIKRYDASITNPFDPSYIEQPLDAMKKDKENGDSDDDYSSELEKLQERTDDDQFENEPTESTNLLSQVKKNENNTDNTFEEEKENTHKNAEINDHGMENENRSTNINQVEDNVKIKNENVDINKEQIDDRIEDENRNRENNVEKNKDKVENENQDQENRDNRSPEIINAKEENLNETSSSDINNEINKENSM